MAQPGTRRDPYLAFNFLVEIEGIVTGGFSECTGLQVEVEIKELREGGVNDYSHRLTGAVKYPPLQLKRGLSDIDGLWEWYQDVLKGKIKRKNGSIYLLDRGQEAKLRWDFKGAFPYKWTGPDLRTEGNNIAFESLELAHRGLRWQRM